MSKSETSTSSSSCSDEFKRMGTPTPIPVADEGHVKEWTPEQVGVWVSSLHKRLATYKDVFIGKSVTGAQLISLKADDFRELGVIDKHVRALVSKVRLLRVASNRMQESDSRTGKGVRRQEIPGRLKLDSAKDIGVSIYAHSHQTPDAGYSTPPPRRKSPLCAPSTSPLPPMILKTASASMYDSHSPGIGLLTELGLQSSFAAMADLSSDDDDFTPEFHSAEAVVGHSFSHASVSSSQRKSKVPPYKRRSESEAIRQLSETLELKVRKRGSSAHESSKSHGSSTSDSWMSFLPKWKIRTHKQSAKKHYPMTAREFEVAIEGWLHKKGPKESSKLTQRWCQLFTNGHLYYFKLRPEAGEEPIGYVDMHKVLKLEFNEGLSFHITTAERVWHFECLSTKKLVDWMAHLRQYIEDVSRVSVSTAVLSAALSVEY